MAIKDWPDDQRPREKLLLQGAGALSDAELLAIFLRTGTAGRSAVDVARQLLKTFGDLRHILIADQQQFCSVFGVGPAKYTQLQAALEMARRHWQVALKRGDLLSDLPTTKRYVLSMLRDYPYELFACLLLDNQHRLICFEKLFRGTVNATSVYPREVVKLVLDTQAAAVIFAHNHPSGTMQVSQGDQALTKRLIAALALIDVPVLDHFVVADTQVVSFNEQGLI